MLPTTYPHMLWVIYRGYHILWCGTPDVYVVDDIVVVHTIYILCCPRHILHNIYIWCCPHHMLHVVHTIYDCSPRHLSHMVWRTRDFSILWCGHNFDMLRECRICAYGVDNTYAVDNMLWTACAYTVGNMGYAVGICCGYTF